MPTNEQNASNTGKTNDDEHSCASAGGSLHKIKGNGGKGNGGVNGDNGTGQPSEAHGNNSPMRLIHPERYGAEGGVNRDIHPGLRQTLAPAINASKGGRIKWKRMYRCCNKRYSDLVKWKGFQFGICHRYESGFCGKVDCDAAHLASLELPRGYVDVMVKDVGPGVREYASRNHYGGASKRGNDGHRGGPTPKKAKRKLGTGGNGGANDGKDGSTRHKSHIRRPTSLTMEVSNCLKAYQPDDGAVAEVPHRKANQPSGVRLRAAKSHI